MKKAASTYIDALLGHYMDQISRFERKPASIAQALALMREFTDMSLGSSLTGEKTRLPDGRVILDVSLPHSLTRSGLYTSDEDILPLIFQQDGLRPILIRSKDLRAIQVTEQTIQTFLGVQSRLQEDAWAILIQHEWYLDFCLAPLPFQFDGETHYLRALTINPLSGLSGQVFRFRGEDRLPVIMLFDNGTTESIGEDFQYWHFRKPLIGPGTAGFSHEMRALLEDLIEHLVLYFGMAPEEHATPLPRLQGKELKRLTPIHQRKALEAGKSLFHIIRLDAPRDRLGRGEERGEKRWTLDHRIEVRGHFRMQAHGPQHSLRRLQWIKPFEKGPKGSPLDDRIKLYRPKGSDR